MNSIHIAYTNQIDSTHETTSVHQGFFCIHHIPLSPFPSPLFPLPLSSIFSPQISRHFARGRNTDWSDYGICWIARYRKNTALHPGECPCHSHKANLEIFRQNLKVTVGSFLLTLSYPLLSSPSHLLFPLSSVLYKSLQWMSSYRVHWKVWRENVYTLTQRDLSCQ